MVETLQRDGKRLRSHRIRCLTCRHRVMQQFQESFVGCCRFIVQTLLCFLEVREGQCVFECGCGWRPPALWSGLWFWKWGPSSSVTLRLLPPRPSQRLPRSPFSSRTLIPLPYPLMLSYPLSSHQTDSPLPTLSKWLLWFLGERAKWHYETLRRLSWRITGRLFFQHLTLESGAYPLHENATVGREGPFSLCCLACLNDECTCESDLFRRARLPSPDSLRGRLHKPHVSCETPSLINSGERPVHALAKILMQKRKINWPDHTVKFPSAKILQSVSQS